MVKTVGTVQIGAANALADWKYAFSRSVRKNAQAISRRDGNFGEITRKHYQLAAQIALKELAEQISEEIHNGQRKIA